MAAADALGFTPSAVSQQIKRLERQTGVPLLERVGRGVMLTRHGRHLVEQGTRLLSDLEELQSGLHRQAGTVAGHVRLAAFSTAMRGLIAPALPPVLAANPGLRVSLTEREPWDAIDLVASGQADLGVAHNWGDVPLPVPAHVTSTALARDLADVIVRRDHALAGRPVVTPRDLAAENWIATPEGTICRQWLQRMYDGTGSLPGSRTCRWNSPATWRWSARGSASRSFPGSAAPRSALTWWRCWPPTRCRAARSWRCTAPR